MAEKTRYTPEELAEFRVIINEKLTQALEDYTLLSDQLSNRDNNGTDDTARKTSDISDRSETLSRDEMNQLAARQQKFITNLQNALLRIQNGTYGICKTTGELISAERLRLVPHTTESAAAKNARPVIGRNIARSVMSTL